MELIEVHGLHRMGNYKPDKNIETHEVKMLQDLNMHHYHVIETRRPNVVIVVKAERENVCKIIDPLGIVDPLGALGVQGSEKLIGDQKTTLLGIAHTLRKIQSVT